jgi:hypothetical protein
MVRVQNHQVGAIFSAPPDDGEQPSVGELATAVPDHDLFPAVRSLR